MYDLNISKKFCLSCSDLKNPAWWGGEPVSDVFLLTIIMA